MRQAGSGRWRHSLTTERSEPFRAREPREEEEQGRETTEPNLEKTQSSSQTASRLIHTYAQTSRLSHVMGP